MFYFFIVAIQLIFLAIYLVNYFIFTHKRKNEVKELDEINKNDKEKFKYYRELLENYSISELCYLFNGKNNRDLLIMSELEWLLRNNYISIENNNIIVNSGNDNLQKSEQYLLNHYKFLNDGEFKDNFIKIIEESLKEKECITTYRLKSCSQLICPFALFVIISYISILFTNGSPNSFTNFELLLFSPIFWIIFAATMITFSKKVTNIKTSKGKDIYLKLNGLKNYIKDFGNFDEKELKEIALWEEYILYAIILDESKTLSKQANEELNRLIKIIYY